MFERFTHEARAVVIEAQLQTRALRHDVLGTEHLLLAAHGLTLERATAAVQELRGELRGATPEDGDEGLDGDALRAVGIDLDTVRRSVEATFGAGALDAGGPGRQRRGEPGRRRRLGGQLPFSPRAKIALELSLREAIRLRQKEIRDLHLLLGLLREGEGLAAAVLFRAGIDTAALRLEIETRLRQAG